MRRRDFMKTAARGTAAFCSSSMLSRPSIVRSASSRTLRYIPQTDLTVIDPVATTAYITRHHGLMIWDQLYGIDAKLRPQPQMVAGHRTENDGKLWSFRLRDGLRFHDGEPVRGRDCVASIRRWAARDPLGQALMTRVAEMSAPDDQGFVIRLHKPFGALLDALAKVGPPALLIMPERLALTDPYQMIKEVVGSGPFKWAAGERIVGARVVYERFDGYVPREGNAPDWLSGPKRVNFDRVEWTVMPDPNTALSAMRTGGKIPPTIFSRCSSARMM